MHACIGRNLRDIDLDDIAATFITFDLPAISNSNRNNLTFQRHHFKLTRSIFGAQFVAVL